MGTLCLVNELILKNTTKILQCLKCVKKEEMSCKDYVSADPLWLAEEY